MSGHCLRTSAVLKRVGEVIGDDLSSADAVIVGSPVYVGNMSGLGTGTGKMRYKVGAAFATGASGSNGKEITMLTILGAMLGSEMIVISGGGPFGRFGASATTGSESPGIDAKEIRSSRPGQAYCVSCRSCLNGERPSNAGVRVIRSNALMAGATTQSSHLTMRLETDLRTSSQCSRTVPAQPSR